MKNYYYLLINVGVILVPLLLSFDKRVQFYKKFKAVFVSITSIGLLFILGDILYTKLGFWGFNERYLTGISLFDLPLSEILFFVTVPYACLFIYESIRTYFNKLLPPTVAASIYGLTAILSIILLASNYTGAYTVFASVFALLAAVFVLIKKPLWWQNFALSFTIAIIPFILVNGILTGTGIEQEIVWYSEEAIVGIRFGTIPLEDFFYAFNLLLLNVLVYEKVIGDQHDF